MKKHILMACAILGLAAISCQLFSPAPVIPPTMTPLPPTMAPTLTPTLPPSATPLPSPTMTVTATPETPVPGADSMNDPYYPQMGNGGYDTLHYTIDLTVDVSKNKINGSTTIDAQTTEALSAFNLDFHGLEVSAVTVNAVPATFSRENDELIITPATALANQEKFSVMVSYSGSPQPVNDAAVPGEPVGWFGDDGIYVVSEVAGSMGWYPVNNHPLDKATYTFRITAPKQYTVAANGLITSETENGDAKTTVWEMAHPMSSYLATLVIGKYELVQENGPDGLPIHNYFPPQAGQDIKDSFSRTSAMIAYYSETFGPYPFESYGVAVLPFELGFALENQTLSIFGEDSADEITAAHELSHQWFGDSVSLKTWKDIWLNEGFATYAEALWVEHTEGKAAGDKYMQKIYADSVADKMYAPANPPVEDLFRDPVYYRGGCVLYALRLTVGDDVFFKILREYYARYQYSNAGTQDFIKVAEDVSGQDLTGFFDAWLFSDKIPPLPNSNR